MRVTTREETNTISALKPKGKATTETATSQRPLCDSASRISSNHLGQVAINLSGQDKWSYIHGRAIM